MVANARDMKQRLQTLVYLFRLRYELDAQVAAEHLSKEAPDNELCRSVLEELRVELASPSVNLGLGSLVSEPEAREYLKAVLRAVRE